MRKADSGARLGSTSLSGPISATAREMDRLYEAYVAPLETDHLGELIVVTPDGRYKLGLDEYELAKAAHAEFGSGVYMFKVGPRAVHRMQ